MVIVSCGMALIIIISAIVGYCKYKMRRTRNMDPGQDIPAPELQPPAQYHTDAGIQITYMYVC